MPHNADETRGADDEEKPAPQPQPQGGGTMYDDGRTVMAAARRWYQTLADYHQAVAIWHTEGGEPNMIAVHQAANRHNDAKQGLAQAVKELREFEAAQLAALDEVFGHGTVATYSLVAQLTGEA